MIVKPFVMLSRLSCFVQLKKNLFSDFPTTAMMNESPEFLASKYINLGVEYYENGQLEQATVAFANALSTTKRIVEYDDEECTRMDNPIGPFQPHFVTSKTAMPSTNDLFLFLHPMKIQAEFPQAKLCKTLSFITMFNLAICNHRNAILNNMNKSTLLIALQLYELAYAIQMKEGIDLTLTPTMIIMSNVGHIHKILGNDDNAQQCFQHLLSTLMFLVEAGERDVVWEFEGFFENILKTIYSNYPAAAA